MKGRLCVLVLAVAIVGGCDKKTPPPPSGAARPAPAVSASARPAEQPWFVGTWSATFTAQTHEVESPKDGYVKEWREVDAGEFTGPGTLTLHIDASGRITGGTEGALGSLAASGEVSDETLSVTLSPKPAADAQQISSAVPIAKRDGDGAKGTLSASTGDSLRVRRAELALARTSTSTSK
jgi:hypothetical protein